MKKKPQKTDINLTYLRKMGLWPAIRGTPLEAYFRTSFYPQVSVDIDPKFLNNSTCQKIKKEAEFLLRKMTLDVPVFGEISVQNLISVVKPILDRLFALRNVPIHEDHGILQPIAVAVEKYSELFSHDFGNYFCLSLYYALHDIVLLESRIEDQIYYFVESNGRDETSKKLIIKFDLHVAKSRKINVFAEGGKRPAYQCAGSNHNGLEWVEWSGDVIGGDSARVFPVYVQSHALRHLFGPDNRFGVKLDTRTEALLRHCLFLSLHRPTIQKMPGRDEYLVDFKIGQHKLGYIVVTCEGDLILARTFLFLTMDGTPEGKRLWDRLRISRTDKSYLGLDNFATFAHTDIKDDPELVKVLEECGCGHLLYIADEPDVRKAFAKEFRNYCQIG